MEHKDTGDMWEGAVWLVAGGSGSAQLFPERASENKQRSVPEELVWAGYEVRAIGR